MTPSSPSLLERARGVWLRVLPHVRNRGFWLIAALIVLTAAGAWISRATIVDIATATGAQGVLLFTGIALILTVLFLALFVGNPTQVKIDRMVAFSYFFTLIAIGGSVLPFFAFQFLGGLEEAMRISPIGFVTACQVAATASELPAEIRCPASQWVLNIGGILRPPDDAIPMPHLEGGLTVPLYFIVLSLMGAAVGMARRVPEYQRRFSGYLALTETNQLAGLDADAVKALKDTVDLGPEKAMSPHLVRENLVFQVMQVVSAPLIAIVAYHLVEPDDISITVAVGFAAGFGAEPILMLIRRISTAIAPPTSAGST